jgi:hypothetical protein
MSLNKKYLVLSLILFITEVLIALYVRDALIRPYFGDVLVVILLYCIVRTFRKVPVLPTIAAILLFAYVLETLQYFNLIEHLRLQHSKLARTLIGTDFAWGDMLAYTAGGLTVIFGEKLAGTL